MKAVAMWVVFFCMNKQPGDTYKNCIYFESYPTKKECEQNKGLGYSANGYYKVALKKAYVSKPKGQISDCSRF